MRPSTDSRKNGLPCAAFLAACALWAMPWQAGAATPPVPAPVPAVVAAPAGNDTALSADAARTAGWIRATGDNRGRPFALVDKRAARLLVFDAAGRPVASSPVLLGLARGDRSVPGIGERKMSEIRPHERTTPAGRFDSEPGRNLQDEDIVWVDYDAAVSMHRVRAANAAERRLQRLSTPTPEDNRISYGCINVPRAFYDRHVAPVFGRAAGVVYVLPETQSAEAFFGMAGPGAARSRARTGAAG